MLNVNEERERKKNFNNSIPFAIISSKIKKQYVISFYIPFIQTLYKEFMAVSLWLYKDQQRSLHFHQIMNIPLCQRFTKSITKEIVKQTYQTFSR